jgi:PAS domain S-box-containing protein
MAQNTYSIRPDLFALFVLEGIRRSIESGLTPEAARVFQNLALLLCGMPGGDVDKGFQFGMLAMALGEKYKVYAVGPSAMVTWAYKRDLRSSLQILEPLYSRLKEVGDFEFAGYAACMRLSNALFCAKELAGLEREMAAYYEDMKRIRAEVGCRWLSAYWQAAQNLLGRSTCPWVLDGQAYNREAMLRAIVETGNLAAQTTLHVNTLMLCYMFGRYDEALVATGLAEECRSGMIAMPIEPVWYFYDSLTRLALASKASEPGKGSFLERVASNQAYLELRAHHAPMNYLNKWLLVEAERARVGGDGMAAAGHYKRAIAAASENGLVHEEALANEMAARFWASEGHPDYARLHIERAHECYTCWQAWAKTKALEEEFPQLPAARARPYPETAPAVQHLDTSAMVKASQAVSGEIELPKLIETLMTITLENAGADRGLLILAQDAGFEVEVEAEASRTGVEVKLSRPAIAETLYPEAIINYVIRTQKSVILDDASHPGAIFEDGYWRSGRARSVFCLPMLRQGKLAGVLYLENTQATHAFTPDRVAVLDVLAAQAAISLENARTYEALRESEAKIRCLVDSSIIGIFTFQLPHEGREAADPLYGEVNDAFLRMLGYEREEFFSGRIRRSDLTPPDWWDRDMESLVELRATGAIKPFEKEYFRKDGSRLPVWAGVASFDAARTQGVAFVIDITGRKRAEKELQTLAEERAILGTALNRSHDAALLADNRGRFLYVNDQACRALGYSREELLAMSVPDIDPDHQAERIALNNQRVRDEGAITFEADPRTKDGRQFPVEVTLSAFDYDGKDYFITLARDITERKRAEKELQALAEQRAVLETALNRSHEAAMLMDSSARFLYVNDEASRALGYSREELLAMSVLDVDPGHSAARVALVHQSTRDEGPVTFESSLRAKDGHQFPVEISLSAFDYGGKDYYIALGRDITERKRAEETLKRSEAHLAEAQKLAHIGSWVRDGRTGENLYWSEEMFRIFGFDPQNGLPMGDSILQLVHPEDRSKFKQAHEMLRAGNRDVEYEFRILTTDGSLKHIHVLAHPTMNVNGDVVEVVGTSADITERKRAEQEMSLLNFAMNNVREAAFLVAEDGRLRYINDEACGRLQYTKEELLNLSVPDIDPDCPWERWLDIWRNLKEQPSRIREGRHKTRSGRIIPVEINSNYFEYANGGYCLSLVRDITDRKRAEAEYNELQAEMARAQRISTMGQFAASIAHEISQPIAAARNNASAALRFLKRTLPDLEQAGEALACVVNDTGRAGQIIERIRDQIKKAPPRSESFDINEAIKATLALVSAELVKNEVSVKTLLAPELPPVRGDRIQLQQVLLNLIHNAVEAMIPVDESERALSLSTAQTEAGSVFVTVRDTGMGIGAESLGHVFEAFYTTKSNGVGIGLSLCRSIVEAHGGRLWVETNEPRGAQFRFNLPAEK